MRGTSMNEFDQTQLDNALTSLHVLACRYIQYRDHVAQNSNQRKECDDKYNLVKEALEIIYKINEEDEKHE